jgi:hypothetical protein
VHKVQKAANDYFKGLFNIAKVYFEYKCACQDRTIGPANRNRERAKRAAKKGREGGGGTRRDVAVHVTAGTATAASSDAIGARHRPSFLGQIRLNPRR